jgi:hypothetical protein
MLITLVADKDGRPATVVKFIISPYEVPFELIAYARKENFWFGSRPSRV